MKTLWLKNTNAVLLDEKTENVSLLIKDGRISEISKNNKEFAADEIIDLADETLYAGFIDIHNHGAVGVDVNTGNVEDLHKVSRFLATKGVCAWLPTLVPDRDENYAKIIGAIDELMETQNESEAAARILGVHYEGVFANEKMCGALRPKFFKQFIRGDEVEHLPKLKAPNAIHLTTLAPEIAGGIDLIKELKNQNWLVSIGHTRADIETLNQAFDAGASQVTHLFNAMTGVHHRDLGVAGWALMNDQVTCEIIADVIHVAPEMLKFAYRNKTAEGLTLVSDSVAPTGLGDGTFELWNEKISVAGGRTQNERGSIAGSVITMLDAVKTMISLGIDEREVSRMASLNPARTLGIEKDFGSIEIGKRADLVALDEQGNVILTIVGGKTFY